MIRGGPGFLGLLTIAVLCATCTRDPAAAARRYGESAARFAARGHDAAALIEYRNAVRQSPWSGELYQRMGDVLARLGRADEARQAYDRAESMVAGAPLPRGESALRSTVAAHPRHVGARLALASRLIERGERTEAEAHLRTALAVDPARELTNRGLAALYLAEGRTDDAEARFRVAAAARPQRYRSEVALADFLIAQRRWDDARPVLAQAGQDVRLADAVAVRLAAVEDATGAHVEARQRLADLLDRTPSAEAWTLQAQFAFRDGVWPASLEAADRALAIDPAFPPALALIDAIRWHQLRPTDASR